MRNVPRLPALAAHVFVDNVDAPSLNDADEHHLTRVLRLRDGEEITTGDGRGKWRVCVVKAGALEPITPVETFAKPDPFLTIGFSLTKGDKPELTVQKLTEIGVDAIAPMTTGHSIVKWDDAKSARNVERWRAIARGAAMQSRRAWLPTVHDVVPFNAIANADVALAHPDGEAISLGTPTILIGPEGGWTDAELASVPAKVDLGGTTLRAETAALVAGALLVAVRDQRI